MLYSESVEIQILCAFYCVISGELVSWRTLGLDFGFRVQDMGVALMSLGF